MNVLTLSAFADEISPDLDVQLAECARHGLDAIELRGAFGKNVMAFTDEEARTVRSKCEDQGLRVQGIGSPVGKVAADESTPEKEDAKLARALEIASLVGTERIRIFLPILEGGLADIAPWIAPQLKRAEDAGAILLHENDARYWGAFPENARALFGEFGGPHLKAAFDFANTVLIGYRPVEDWLTWIIPHLDTLHIKDAKDGRVVPAGQGDGQMRQAFTMLKDWPGHLALEPHLAHAGEFAGFSGPELFARAVRALRELQEESEEL